MHAMAPGNLRKGSTHALLDVYMILGVCSPAQMSLWREIPTCPRNQASEIVLSYMSEELNLFHQVKKKKVMGLERLLVM